MPINRRYAFVLADALLGGETEIETASYLMALLWLESNRNITGQNIIIRTRHQQRHWGTPHRSPRREWRNRTAGSCSGRGVV